MNLPGDAIKYAQFTQRGGTDPAHLVTVKRELVPKESQPRLAERLSVCRAISLQRGYHARDP